MAAAKKAPWDPLKAPAIVLLHVGALTGLLHFTWSALGVALCLYVVTILGITLGYHRLLTHRSFRTPKWVEYLLTLSACLSCQGGPISWVAVHRRHHAHADGEGDPHGAHEGFWWSHVRWLMSITPNKIDPEFRARYAPDMLRDPVHRALDRWWFALTVLLGAVLLGVGGLPWLMWGLFVRLTVGHHAVWLVNSAGHSWGYRSFETDDLSTNCWWVALMNFGEGWHNNHHAFPSSARFGLRWWEVDPAWLLIRLMERLGLAWDVKVPTDRQMARWRRAA